MKRQFQYGAWAPDQVGSPVGRIFNVMPATDGWAPFPMPAPTTTVGMTGLPSLLAAVRSASGIDYTIAANQTTVFRAGPISWAPFSGEFNAVTPWQMVVYGDVAYFANGRDQLLKIDLNGSVGPEPVPDMPHELGFRYLAQVADVIMGAWCVEAEFTQFPFRTQWSGVGRPDRYTPNTTIGSDFQDHTDIGELRGLTGGEYALIHGANGLIRGDYVGPPFLFEFRTLETDVGCEYPGSLASSSGRCFWWSRTGFRFSGGGPSQAIGFGLVDEFFRSRVRKDFVGRISAAIYPEFNCYIVAYPGPDSFDGTPSELLSYNYAIADPNRRWGFGQAEIQVLGRGNSAIDPFTDEPPFADLFTDDIAGNTDDSSDASSFGAAIADGKLCRLTPVATTRCEIETGETRLLPGQRCRAIRAWPLVEPNPTNMRLRVYTRERQDSSATNQTSPDLLREEDSGSIACDDAGQLHRFSLRWDGVWRKAQGLAVEFVAQGNR